jgi:hypothetical protein
VAPKDLKFNGRVDWRKDKSINRAESRVARTKMYNQKNKDRKTEEGKVANG